MTSTSGSNLYSIFDEVFFEDLLVAALLIISSINHFLDAAFKKITSLMLPLPILANVLNCNADNRGELAGVLTGLVVVMVLVESSSRSSITLVMV